MFIRIIITITDIYVRVGKHNLFTFATFTLHYWRKCTWKWWEHISCFCFFCCYCCCCCCCSCCRLWLYVFYFLFITTYSTVNLFRSQWWSIFKMRSVHIMLQWWIYYWFFCLSTLTYHWFVSFKNRTSMVAFYIRVVNINFTFCSILVVWNYIIRQTIYKFWHGTFLSDCHCHLFFFCYNFRFDW